MKNSIIKVMIQNQEFDVVQILPMASLEMIGGDWVNVLVVGDGFCGDVMLKALVRLDSFYMWNLDLEEFYLEEMFDKMRETNYPEGYVNDDEGMKEMKGTMSCEIRDRYKEGVLNVYESGVIKSWVERMWMR